MANIGVDRTRGKGNLVMENRDCPSSIEDKVEGQTEKTHHTFLDNMDSIAYGVEAWFEENTGYSRRVAETTVAIARALGVPASDIKRWASSRSVRDTEKGRVIKSLLQRLQQSSVKPCDNGNISDSRYEVNLV